MRSFLALGLELTLWRNLVFMKYSKISSPAPTCFLPSRQFDVKFRRFISSFGTQPHLSAEIIQTMEQRLAVLERRSSFLQDLMSKQEASPAEYAKANKELTKLRFSIDLIHGLRAKQKEIDGLKSLMDEYSEDKDMLDMTSEELGKVIEEERKLQMSLLKSLLPKDDADERDCILEVPEEKKHLYLQWRYSKCMKDIHRRKGGNLKFWM